MSPYGTDYSLKIIAKPLDWKKKIDYILFAIIYKTFPLCLIKKLDKRNSNYGDFIQNHLPSPVGNSIRN